MRKYEPTLTGAGSVLAACLVLVLGAIPTTTLGALWTPADVGTIAWYDASDTNTTIPVSGTITTWLDKGANGLDMSGGDGPTTGDRTINGLNVMNMNGNRAHFSCANFPVPSNGNISVFMVTAIDAVNADDDCAFAMLNSLNGNQWWTLAPGTNTQFNGAINSKNYFGMGLPLTGGPYDGGTNIFNAVFNFTATNLSVYVDGINRGSNSSYTFKLTLSQTFRLFRGANGPKHRVAPGGAIAEVVVIEDCSTDTRQKFEGYLAWKWGLEGNLPVGHPCHDEPPMLPVPALFIVIR